MRALRRAPSPSRRAVERLLASSRSLVARCSSQACSSDWAALSLDEVENVKESEPIMFLHQKEQRKSAAIGSREDGES